MNKALFRAAGLAGLLAVAWVAAGYLRSNPLALAMTLLIGAFYAMGVLELHRYAKDTAAVNDALAGLGDTATGAAAPAAASPAAGAPADAAALSQWLARLPASLRTSVALRVQGVRAAMPAPALAPYLAGLLVLLGMLGTFVGMVVTLNGTGLALEQATSVQTMRDSLAAPVRGLGLAFGTSVAGVAASAMLGLMSALCRRERQQAGQLLDLHTASTLQPFSSTSQRERQEALQHEAAARQRQEERAADQKLLQQRHDETLHLHRQQHGQTTQAQQQRHADGLAAQQQRHAEALLAQRGLATAQTEQLAQQQAEFWPAMANRLQALMDRLDQQSQQSAAQLLAGQQQFHVQAQQAYGALAASVDETLRHSLESGARQASELLAGAVQATLQGITRDTTALHSQVSGSLQQQLHGLAQHFETLTGGWLQAVGDQAQQQQAALLQAVARAQAEQQAQHTQQDQQRLAAFSATLAALATKVEHSGTQAAERAEAQASSTITEVARLVHSATEAPRAAAEGVAQMVAQLRDKLSDSLARDTAMLEERSRIMATLNTVLAAAQHTATEQKAAIDQMVATTAAWLQQAGARFTEQAQADSARLETVSAQLTSSAAEVASLGEAFGAAVDQFSQGSGQLLAHLQNLEAALERNTTRSDEQLAYYVAQAREVIDLSLLSQKQIVDELQGLGSRGAAWAAAGAAGAGATAAIATPAAAAADNGASSATIAAAALA